MIESIINTILTYYPKLEAIYLYGSYARGEETSTSDIDICVLMPKGMEVDRYDFPLNLKVQNKIDIITGIVFCNQINEWCEKKIYPND